MKTQTILCLTSLMILLPSKSNTESAICGRSKICQCFNNSDHYEYQCSENEEEEEIIMHVNPSNLIRIDCTNIQTLIARKLPEVKFENIPKLEIRYCPVPQSGIAEIVDHFGLKNLNHLTFEFGIFDDLTLPTEKFAGFPNVTVLRLRSNDLVTIGDGFFANFPNLLSLELDRNRLILKNDTFSALSTLKFLSISDNKLQEFPEGLFEGLVNLEKLNLWKNEIQALRGNTFEGLKSLKSLELAYNKLEKIEENSLDPMKNLVNISIRSNLLKNLSRKNFESNILLETVRASGNLELLLLDDVFSNFPNLRHVDLSSSGLKYIPNNIFEHSTALEKIDLDRNEIQNLTKGVFDNLNQVKSLSLSFNQINFLDGDIFDDMARVEILNLNHNKMEEIGGNIFKPLTKLRELDLSFNNISNIPLDTFVRNTDLQKISLSHNRYVYEDNGIFPISPFNKCGDLQEINLSHNEIKDFPEDLMRLTSMKSIDLSWNNISNLEVKSLWKVTINELNINLQHNRITRLNFAYVELIAKNQPDLDAFHNVGSSVVVEISHNPFVCDCYAFDFARYINGEMYPGVKTEINFVYKDLNCTSPEIFKGIPVGDVIPPMLTCPIRDVIRNFSCTNGDECGCAWRPYDSTLVIDCHDESLTSIPEIYHPTQLIFNQTEVNLEGNNLTKGPSWETVGYNNVTKLFLGKNSISEIDWIPPRIEVLDMRSNNLQNIHYDVLHLLNSTYLREIYLGSNPWTCDCTATNLTNFLRQHVHKIDTTDILCKGSSKPLVNLSQNDLCPQKSTFYLASATVLVLILCIVSCLTAFYYKFQQEIKIWMYAHNILLFLIEEEELDKDKIYDAFVSYSHKDQEFVEEKLISILESGPEPYKLCIHIRNWIPGELISTQITSSVRDSKRTLVILSPGFLESVWGKMEFRTAHSEAMREGRARVIIVLYGDIDIDSLDDELKAYMKTNTYIKWGDPWFWDKLRYALPHSKIKGKNSKSQKHANMMNYIDDKFSLINRKRPDCNSSLSICEKNGKKIDFEEDSDENSMIKRGIV